MRQSLDGNALRVFDAEMENAPSMTTGRVTNPQEGAHAPETIPLLWRSQDTQMDSLSVQRKATGTKCDVGAFSWWQRDRSARRR